MKTTLARAARVHALTQLLAAAKRLARRYYALTHRPLGITGEVAEYEAVRLLRLTPAEVRQPGYDAEGRGKDGRKEPPQIKGCCIIGKLKPGARVGAIDLTKPWDVVRIVLPNADFDATAIYRAERRAVCAALLAPGSKARNRRGQLSISKFKAMGHRVWPRDASAASRQA